MARTGDPRAVESLLGVLKAGGAYLPLDSGYPIERLAFMIEDAQMIARRMLAFRMRVHIGVEDRELAIDFSDLLRVTREHT